MKKGFRLEENGPIIYYLDCWGKDVAFERWRIYAYYKPGFAKTLLFDSEVNYNKFIETHKDEVYDSYDEFWEKRNKKEYNEWKMSSDWKNK